MRRAGLGQAAAVLPADTATDATLADLRMLLADLSDSAPSARRALRQRLMDALPAGPPALRALAAAGLGRVGDDRAVPLLVSALTDPHPLVQWNAAHALRALSAHGLVSSSTLAFEDGTAFNAWQQALLDRVMADLAAPSPAARQDAAAVLVALDAVVAIPALLAALPDPDPAVYTSLRHACYRIIGRAPERLDQARPALVTLLRHADPLARQAAALVIADLGARSLAGRLAPLLHDADPRVRAGAAHALGRLGDLAGSADLQALLIDDAPPVRSAAAWALGALGDPYAAPALLQMAADEDPIVRRAVLMALAGIAAPESLPVLLAALATDDPLLRYHAAAGLSRLGDARALKPLAAVQRDRRAVAGTTVGDAAAAAALAIRGRRRRVPAG